MRMRTILTIFIVLGIVTGLLGLSGCKKSEEAETNYTLTVQVTNGANGSPATGSYTYKKDDQVPYSYTLKDAYQNLKVTLDGQTIDNSGTITISGDQSLYVFADPNPSAFTLTVSVGSGVDGTPITGTTYYLPNAQVPYSYSLKEYYIDLKVVFDGVEIANNGSITILKNSALAVSATLHYDIRGTWSMSESYSDGSSFNDTMTFTGTDLEGTVTDSNGGVGTYTVQGTYITINLNYPEVTYLYTGLFADKDNISGTSKRTIVATGAAYGGSWKGTRNQTISSLFSGLFNKKNKGEY